MKSEYLAEVKVVMIPNYSIGLIYKNREPQIDNVSFSQIDVFD